MPVNNEPLKAVRKCIVYGERPITELSLAMMTVDDVGRLINGIELKDGGRIPLEKKDQLQQIFVEAPLGRRFGVIDLLLTYNDFSIMCEIKPDSYDKVSDRLDAQLPRYLASIDHGASARQTRLVRRVHDAISKKKTFLITVTKDSSFPPRLKEFYRRLQHTDAASLGWASYTHLSSVLEREGFVIEGTSPHIWARER